MPRPIIIASLTFPTKNAAKEFFRDIRDRYEDDQRISLEDEGFLRDLIAIHPEADTKIGRGISHFSVARDAKFGTTRHFVIHRTDGSHTDVSFHSSIDGRNDRRDRHEALRRAIEGQILDFKASKFSSGENLICPLRRVPITETSYHIDHKPPRTFVELASRWLDAEGFSLMDLAITPPGDNQIVTEMTNSTQLSSWQNFHAQHAELRILSPRGNLSDAKTEK